MDIIWCLKFYLVQGRKENKMSKMSDGWKAFWVWTVVIVLSAIGGSFLVTKDGVYTGTDIELSVGDHSFMTINGSSGITFNGASSSFFLLRQETGETIVAIPTTPPLGWHDSTYFLAGPVQIKGKWLIEKGSATVRLISDANMTIYVISKDKPMSVLIICIAVLIAWFLGIWIAVSSSSEE